MINIYPITDAYLYVYGSWKSQALLNATSGFPVGTTSEWGYLAWDETYTTGYTGQVRIDILNAAETLVLIADIARNTDGSPTDISSLGTVDIKVRVKIYGLDYPTPIVSNIRLKYKNWNQEQIITNDGKNFLFNRALLTPTTNPVYDLSIGNTQSATPITETTTTLVNIVTTQPTTGTFTSVTYDETNQLAICEFDLNNSDFVIANGTVMNSIGFRNNDASKLFIGGSRYKDITKSVHYSYIIKTAFKVYGKASTTSIMTQKARNIFVNRAFATVPTYTGMKYGITGYQTTALTDTMTGFDNTYFGPSAFAFIILDTSKYRLTASVTMGIADGNSYNYNIIGHENNDVTKQLMYAALTDEDLPKTTNYIYNFNTNYNILTPISTLL